MSDLKILEKDGWLEVDGFEGAVIGGQVVITEFWAYAGQGDAASMAAMLVEAGLLSEDEEAAVREVRVAVFPDDIVGDVYRVWVLTKGSEK